MKRHNPKVHYGINNSEKRNPKIFLDDGDKVYNPSDLHSFGVSDPQTNQVIHNPRCSYQINSRGQNVIIDSNIVENNISIRNVIMNDEIMTYEIIEQLTILENNIDQENIKQEIQPLEEKEIYNNEKSCCICASVDQITINNDLEENVIFEQLLIVENIEEAHCIKDEENYSSRSSMSTMVDENRSIIDINNIDCREQYTLNNLSNYTFM
jgi:hypothetical protein